MCGHGKPPMIHVSHAEEVAQLSASLPAGHIVLAVSFCLCRIQRETPFLGVARRGLVASLSDPITRRLATPFILFYPYLSLPSAFTGHRRSISAKISSAHLIASAMAATVAGTRFPPSQFASFRAAKIDAAMSSTRFRPSSILGDRGGASPNGRLR